MQHTDGVGLHDAQIELGRVDHIEVGEGDSRDDMGELVLFVSGSNNKGGSGIVGIGRTNSGDRRVLDDDIFAKLFGELVRSLVRQGGGSTARS